MTIFFLIIGLLPLISGHSIRRWALITGIIFLLVTLVKPAILEPLNQFWFKLGLLLHKITSPIILGLMFFLVITPIGLVKRLGKNKSLAKSFDKSRQSYWLDRNPPGPSPDSFKDQF